VPLSSPEHLQHQDIKMQASAHDTSCKSIRAKANEDRSQKAQQFTGMAWHALPAFDQTRYTVGAAAAAAVRLRGIEPPSAPPEANQITT